jgi:uncharacterized coiled-coil DUF342 family protein
MEVQEQEISDMFTKLTAAFDYIKQTFVNANQFAEQVRQLQTQVTQLTQDVEQLKQHNHALDEAISALTHERDEARNEAQGLKWQLSQVTQERDQAATNFQQSTDKVTDLLAQLEEVRQENTKWREECYKLQDNYNAAKEKLDKIQSALGMVENTSWPQAVNQ